MTLRGAPSSTGPNACPFIALELDRDRRSERPDYRHRCYAEQIPAPRTIAHQERYCLSPNFSGCPIFQGWAIRAAARPLPLPPGVAGRQPIPGEEGPADHPEAAAPAFLTAQPAVDTSAPAEDWPDSMDAPPPLAPLPLDDEPVGTQQLSAFDAPPTPSVSPRAAAEAPPLPAPQPPVPPVDEPEPVAVHPEPPMPPDEQPAAAPVPAFLAGRSSRPRPSPKADERSGLTDVVPSWGIDGRYGAEPSSGSSVNDGRMGPVITAVAVIVILALGVLAVLVVPGLLAGNSGQTTRPSFGLPSGSPGSSNVAVLPSPTSAATAQPTAAVTPVPTPAPTPRFYKVKAGDNMAKIAYKYGVSIADILAANPDVPDANTIHVGQFLIIPFPPATPTP